MADLWGLEARQMQQMLFNNVNNVTWSLFKFFDQLDCLENVRYLFTRLNGNPIDDQEISDMCDEINCNCVNGQWRRDNFLYFLSDFVNKRKETHHDNSASLREIHNMVGNFVADDEQMGKDLINHFINSITDTPNELPESFSDDAKQLSSMIVEYQSESLNNTTVSLVFVVIPINIDGQLFAVPEPVFRIHVGDTNLFVDRRSFVYATWSEYIEQHCLLFRRICYPLSGVYTADAENQIQVAFIGTALDEDDDNDNDNDDDDNDDDEDVSRKWEFFLQHLPTSPRTDQRPDLIGCPGVTTNLISQLFHTRNEWLTSVVCVLSLMAAGANGVYSCMVKKGKLSGRPARVAVGALNVVATSAHACNVANVACSLPAKYKKGTLTYNDKTEALTVCFSFLKHLRICADMCRKIRRVPKCKGVLKKVETAADGAAGKQVTPVKPLEDSTNLASLSFNVLTV